MASLFRRTFLLMLTVALSGCTGTVSKRVPVLDPASTDSRIVAMHLHGVKPFPHIDWARAHADARKQCKTQGYRSARYHEDYTLKCQTHSADGERCLQYYVQIKYACLR